MGWETKQLLRDAARTSFRAVANVDHRPSRAFDDPAEGTFAPRWGTSALLKLAVQAQAVHLVPTGVELRDVGRHPLPPELQEQRSELLVAALLSEDLEGAQRLLQGERGPYEVVTVTLLSDDGAEVAVGRFGRFDASQEEPVEALVHAAESILSIS